MRKWLLAAAMTIAAASFASARMTDPGHLFEHVPAPPKTLAAAVSRVTIAGSPRLTAQTPTYDAVLREVLAQEKTLGTAGGQQQVDQMGLGINLQRMQNDPAYAAKMQEKMAAMSTSQKMAMAQRMTRRWMASQNGEGRTMSAQMAHGQVVTYIGKNEPKDERALVVIDALFRKTIKAVEARHGAVDKKIETALDKCPMDRTGQERVWSCAGPLKDRAVRENRVAERVSLAEENRAYHKARETAKSRVDNLLPVLAMAKQGGDAEDVAIISGEIGKFTRVLASFGRSVTLRAAFWGEPGLSAEFVNATSLQFSVRTLDKRPVDWPSTED